MANQHLRERKAFPIGHVAAVTGIHQSTLRSWEQQGLIDPAKSPSGRRTFSDADIQRIVRIGKLRKVYGYSLAGIRRALEERTDGSEGAGMGPAPDPSPDLERIGSKVRALRLEAGLSLRQVSAQTGLAASHLSMFERGVAFPSPSRLAAIARVFKLSLADLLGGTATRGRAIIRRGEARVIDSFGPGVSVEQLTVSEQLLDCEIWTIGAGAESDGFYSHDGQELMHLLEGELEIALDGEAAQVLRAGDSAYFESTRQHRWRNAGAIPAVVLWVNTDVSRLTSFQARSGPTSLDVGSVTGGVLGEQTRALTLPEGTRTFRVVDTHTAGHPTRVLLEQLEGLDARSVRDKREQFRARYDGLRSLLLHEPRGHAATFGLVPVQSEVADFGAIFVSSYKYLDMCGHGTIGYARVLAALGRLGERRSFSLEVPAGVVQVSLGERSEVTLENVPSFVAFQSLPLSTIAPGFAATIAYGGCWYANVDAAALGIALIPDNVSRLMEVGARIKDAANAALSAMAIDIPQVDSTLFYEEAAGRRPRQLVILERNKFDRSPCGTGLSARMAELAAQGRIGLGERYEVENVLGVPFLGEIVGDVECDGRPAIVPRVTGRAHLAGFSTLIAEQDDPLPDGFLCR